MWKARTQESRLSEEMPREPKSATKSDPKFPTSESTMRIPTKPATKKSENSAS